MNNVHGKESLIVLNVPPSLEEPVVDWLLAREGGAGFTSFPVFGHSTSHEDLSPAEQVSGRQRRQQFQVQMREDAVGPFLDDARKAFGAAGVHFWVLPLSQGGHLRAKP
jgi:hypothetical protein